MLIVREVSGRKGESGVNITVEPSFQAKLPDKAGSPLNAPSTDGRFMGWLK
jgi:hypothetical protein